MKASVIDLGFNSAKMVSYEVAPDRRFRAFQQEGARVRLGEGLGETGFLGSEPIRRTIDTLKVFRDIVKLEDIQHVLPIATSAVREAGNKEEFLETVHKEVGLHFKVLSPRDEAIYSYAGAAIATRIPTSVFFDLGGGSLEIVGSNDFRIKSILSLPLGALRLTYAYGKGDETFSKKGYEKMSERIRDLLPSRRELGMGRETRLIGVGGNLRAIARYHQERTRYPFQKVHNYSMSIDSIDSIGRKLLKTSPNKIAKIKTIGGSRAGTVVAGTCVVRNLMKKLGFREIVISTHGLREGTLAMHLFDRRGFTSGAIGPDQLQEYLNDANQVLNTRSENLRALRASHLIDGPESRILEASFQQDDAPTTISLQSLFFFSMDRDSWLSHREQLIMAISLVCAKNENAAERVYAKFGMMFRWKQWRTIRRIAHTGKLLRLLQREGAKLQLTSHLDRIEMTVKTPGAGLPSNLLKDTMRRFQESSDIRLSYTLEEGQRTTERTMIKHEVRVRK